MKQNLTSTIGSLLLLAGALGAAAQSGGPYNLGWHTIDGGGGRCAGGGFAIHGTIGQPESRIALRSELPTLAAPLDSSDGGTEAEPVYVLRGGFWPGVVREPVGPRLNIQGDDLNHVTLTWPFPSSGYVLHQTTNLNAPRGGWSAYQMSPVVVGTNWQTSPRATGGARLFRLFKR